ncbi:hypothetical protein [Picosynechococcus sp. PCC 8807]|uniref:hypothetical protein n=1 Tax=Picosynechococcus sp. PCC 8807 TaxID=195248 RepID=UPI0018DD4884|nr:hypothetical protein [Picosynechococcus sp. PCC 8807]
MSAIKIRIDIAKTSKAKPDARHSVVSLTRDQGCPLTPQKGDRQGSPKISLHFHGLWEKSINLFPMQKAGKNQCIL